MAWVGGLGRISNETVLTRACPKHFRFMHDFMHCGALERNGKRWYGAILTLCINYVYAFVRMKRLKRY